MKTLNRRAERARLAGWGLLCLVLGSAGGYALHAAPARAQAPAPAQAATPQTQPSAPSTTAAADDALQLPAGMDRDFVVALPERSPLPLAGSDGDGLAARLVPDEDLTVRLSSSVAGRITALHVQPGQRVHAGQLLAEIDSPDLGNARADVDKAVADAVRKRQALQRAEALGAGDAVTQRELESLQADRLQAEAEVQRAAQRLHNLNPRELPLRGETLRLLAPQDGVVLERNANLAQELAPGQGAPLFVISRPERLWLLIDLPEALAAQVQAGSAVDVQSDALPGSHFSATVAQAARSVDPATRRASLRARVANPGGRLLPEMFVRARLLQAQTDALRLPNAALVRHGSQTWVYEQLADGRYRRHGVQLAAQGSETSYVAQGLNGSERLVMQGALLLDAEYEARHAANAAEPVRVAGGSR